MMISTGVAPHGFARSGKMPLLVAASALILALGGCGGDSAGSAPVTIPTPTPTVTPTPSPSPSPTPTPSPTPAPTPSPPPSPTSWSAMPGALYDVGPDINGCRAGTLKQTVRDQFLTQLNALRALHALPAVTYSSADDAQSGETSLMMAANRMLSHTPPTTWLCYSAAGSAGAGSSNLILYTGSSRPRTEDEFLALWMTEGGDSQIGHRRWILDPFLGQTSYSRVTQQLSDGSRIDASSMKVFSFASAGATPTGLPNFVAYPFGDYPVRYFGTADYLSFSVIANKTSRGGNASVSFAGATVSVSSGATSLAVTDVTRDNQGYGVPNNIQWRVTGLQPSVSYTVTISGVTGAPQTSYTYSFKMTP